MGYRVIDSPEKLVTVFYRFLAFVCLKDGCSSVSFVDENTFLGREENYKSKVSEHARAELSYDCWNESWIGTGRILERCRCAMNCAGNLVNRNQQIQFKNMINPNHEKFKAGAERALYDIYKSKPGNQEASAFLQARQVFGNHYDMIGYLFFIKDSSRFLPISSSNFEKSLALVGIEYPLVGRCSWENYVGFIEIVKSVRAIMQDIIPNVDVRLIDAHSFLWVINEKVFREWEPNDENVSDIETATESYLASCATGNAVRKCRITSYITRSVEVARATKSHANGVCQLCGLAAPFRDKKGEPYLETHHIIWLSHGGKDATNNTVALCPNCHTKMHIVNDHADVEKLLNKVK